MATLAEQFDINNNATLLNKIAASVAVEADVIRLEDGATANHANRLLWAKEAFSTPLDMAKRMMPAIIAANRTATKAQIEGASDSSIQSAVSATVNIFATGA